MTNSHDAQHAQEWLERQLAELGQLRNANRRDQNFKAWRQQTVTVIQRVWPGDVGRVDRFRRIPFSPPMTRASDRQVREYYERGWGEAGVLLRQYLADVNLLGLPAPSSSEVRAGAEPAIAPLPAWDEALFNELPPMPDVLEAPAPEPIAPEAPATQVPAPPASEETASAEDDIQRAMERLLSNSPVFRGAPPLPPVAQPLELPAPARDLARAAEEIATLRLAPGDVEAMRSALLALARAGVAPEWSLVEEALTLASRSPALAQRVVPLLLGFIERAA